MADELPSDYDAIVLGTGLPEAVVAAALSRIGHKVLHLDRNDYYAGYWASFSFDHLQEWIKRNTSQDAESSEGCKDPEEGSKATNSNEKHLPIPHFGSAITNIKVQSFLREEENVEKESEMRNLDISKSDVDSEGVKTGATGTIEKTEEENESRQKIVKSVFDSETPLESVEPCKEKTKLCTDYETQVENDQANEPLQETTASNTDSETVPLPEDDTTQTSSAISWEERRKKRKEVKLGRDATFKNFSEQSRKFNLDLAPKVLLSRGSLVESLISANIAHYAEFKVVSRILTYMNGSIVHVPCSRSDVFGSELITVLEKRALMRFITFCADCQDSSEEYLNFRDKPFADFLKARKLTANLQHIVTSSIACVPQNATTLCGLKATQTFLQSLGRYGNTPYLWSLYGSGEVPQAFCRMCAVFGGIYCLRKNVDFLVYEEESKKCAAVITEDGQRLNTKWLIMEKSYAPDAFELEAQSMISRAILITDKSLKPSLGEHVTLLTLRARHSGQTPVHVIELPPSSMACPESLYVVHLIAEASSTAFEDLQDYIKQLFIMRGEEDTGNSKPAVLWALYFNRKCFLPKKSCDLPENVKLTSLPSSQLCFEDAMKEAKSIFKSICPDDEFLLAVPNPEDIIWDDVNDTALGSEEQSTPGSQEQCIPGYEEQSAPTSEEQSTQGSEKLSTPDSEKQSAPSSEEQSTQGSEKLSTPGSEEQSAPTSEEQSTQGSEKLSTPDSEKQSAPSSEEQSTQGSEKQSAPGSGEQSAPDTEERDKTNLTA